MTKIFLMNLESKIIIVAFTKNGINLAQKISSFINAKIFVPERLLDENLEKFASPLIQWTGKIFGKVKAIIFKRFLKECKIESRVVSD